MCVFFFSFSVEQFGKLDESERRTEEYDTLVRHNFSCVYYSQLINLSCYWTV